MDVFVPIGKCHGASTCTVNISQMLIHIMTEYRIQKTVLIPLGKLEMPYRTFFSPSHSYNYRIQNTENYIHPIREIRNAISHIFLVAMIMGVVLHCLNEHSISFDFICIYNTAILDQWISSSLVVNCACIVRF